MRNLRRKLKGLICAVLGTLCFTTPVSFANAQDLSTHDVEREANAGNFDKAYEVLVQLAESGNAQAQGFLAYVLYLGEWGVPADDVTAKKWMKAAYMQNDGYAHMDVAIENRPDDPNPTPVEDRSIVSHDWKTNVRVAAENGHPFAQHLMGKWAKEKYKYKEAVEWFRKAAEAGQDYSAVAMYATQSLYFFPKYMRLNQIQVRVTSGNPEAFAMLHIAYALGYGTKPDFRKAVRYGVLSHAFDFPTNKDARNKTIRHFSQQDIKQLAGEALDLLADWATDPTTDIYKASQWCKETDGVGYECIVQSVARHRICEIPYMMWNFKNTTEFPAYKACRDYYDEYPPLN